jgi:hypothetical protein
VAHVPAPSVLGSKSSHNGLISGVTIHIQWCYSERKKVVTIVVGKKNNQILKYKSVLFEKKDHNVQIGGVERHFREALGDVTAGEQGVRTLCECTRD